MPIEISGNGQYEFVLTAIGRVSGPQQGEVDFYVDAGDALVIKTLAFTLHVVPEATHEHSEGAGAPQL